MSQIFESDGALTFEQIEEQFARLQAGFDEDQSLQGDPRNFDADLSDVFGIDLREAMPPHPDKLGKVSLDASVDLET